MTAAVPLTPETGPAFSSVGVASADTADAPGRTARRKLPAGRGPGIARLLGVACFVLAAVSLAVPGLTPGLQAPPSTPM